MLAKESSMASLTRRRFLPALASALGAPLAGAGGNADIPLHLPEEKHGLRFSTPVTVWDEALPLGNGTLGALIWGDGGPLRISLDRSDLWDLRLVPEFYSPEYSFEQMRAWHEQGKVADLVRLYEAPYNRPAPTKIPAGRMEIALGRPPEFRDTALRLPDAVAEMNLAGARANVFIHATEPVGMVRVLSPAAPELKLVPPPFAGKVGEEAAGGIGAGDLRQLGYPAPVETSGDGWRAYAQSGAESFRYAVFAAWRRQGNEWQAAWSVASSFEGADPQAIARERVERALSRGFDAMHATHKQWWREYWRRSSVRLPNEIVERQWFLEQYKFGAASRRSAPPISLQAVWTADDGRLPPWKGDFHHDLNTQLSYWPCYSGNHLEEGLAYLDWLWKTRDTAFDWTKRFFGLPGMNVPMTADLNGRQIGGWRQYTHSATTSAWLAQHFYLHWKYSGDREFLRQRAYPYLRDTCEFLDAFTAKKGPDGKRTHPLSASPEINDNRPSAWFPSVTNYDLALERWAMSAGAELAVEAGVPAEAARWRQVLSELPAFSLGDDGRLLVAKGYPLPHSHRHFSHLMAIHPLGLIDWSGGDEARKTIAASLAELDRLGSDQWCGYSFSWLANLAARARDGEKAARALEIFSTAFTLRNSFHCNGDQSGKGYSKFTYRPFTLEGNFAAAAGVQEMLLQSHRGVILLFPAVPATWKDVAFTTLRAQGAFLVSAQRTGGAVSRVEIVAERGGRCRLLSPFSGKELAFDMRKGERKMLTQDPA
jgi:alpha-L-fucosidase 2